MFRANLKEKRHEGGTAGRSEGGTAPATRSRNTLGVMHGEGEVSKETDANMPKKPTIPGYDPKRRVPKRFPKAAPRPASVPAPARPAMSARQQRIAGMSARAREDRQKRIDKRHEMKPGHEMAAGQAFKKKMEPPMKPTVPERSIRKGMMKDQLAAVRSV